MVPTEALPPETPSTDQLTVVFTAPETLAVKVWVRPLVKFVAEGDTDDRTGAVIVTATLPVTRSPATLVTVRV